ncbi:MAG: dolichol-phosphate mannosyltransferase [Microgenomates group bacterium Gr01-1014_16]|nr:MAG: dolichol-phosphate mannosyltransferase [Microgenomates group bacterium Gr01-1014_16]
MKKEWQVPEYEKIEFKKKTCKYCLVIPVINEGNKFINQLKKLKPYAKLADIIVADGGSTDGSTDLGELKRLGVTTLLVKTGPGRLGAQYRMAYAWALKRGYQGVVQMDGNGKDSPESIRRFINLLDQGFDYIQGSRYAKGGWAINTPLEREMANRYLFTPILCMAAGKIYTDTSNGHRAYSRKLLLDPGLKLFRDVFSNYEILFYVTARANRLGLRSTEIPVTRSYPPAGETPTKIVGWKKKFDVLGMAIKAAIGYYNPRD